MTAFKIGLTVGALFECWYVLLRWSQHSHHLRTEIVVAAAFVAVAALAWIFHAEWRRL